MMRRRLLPTAMLSLLAGLCCVAPPAPAQFRDPLATPADAVGALAARTRLLAVAAAGQHLVAAGPRGHIVVSADQGATWSQVDVPVSTDLVALRFIDDTRGWAVGHDGVILHSDDGGLHWRTQLDGRRVLEHLGAWFDAQLGPVAADGIAPAIVEDAAIGDDSVAGDGSDPMPTMNLAEARGLLTEGIDKPFFDIAFVSPTEGYAVGAYSLAFRTVDGGETWQPMIDAVDNPRLLHLYGLAASGDSVYLVGEQGLLTRLNRDTHRFEALASPYSGSWFGALADGDRVLVYGLAGSVYRSDDRGGTWTQLDAGLADAIVAGSTLGDGRFALVTQSGRVLLGNAVDTALAPLDTDAPMAYFGVARAGGDRIVLAGAAGVAVESLTPASN